MERGEIKVYLGGFLFAAVIYAALFLSGPTVQAQSAFRGPLFACTADNIAATLTLIPDCYAPSPGTRRYITDIVAQSTTATGGQFILRYGTGTNCGTGTVSLLPGPPTTAARLSAAGNGVQATTINFQTPIVVPPGQDLCVLGVATNTVNITVTGFLGF